MKQTNLEANQHDPKSTFTEQRMRERGPVQGGSCGAGGWSSCLAIWKLVVWFPVRTDTRGKGQTITKHTKLSKNKSTLSQTVTHPASVINNRIVQSFQCILTLRKTMTHKDKKSLSPTLFWHCNEDSEFGWVSIQFQNHQQSTISLTTVASICCLTYFAPSGQRLNVKLLDICHIKESWNVPGSFETAGNEITMTWQNESRWGSHGFWQRCNTSSIKSDVLQQISLFSLLCLSISLYMFSSVLPAFTSLSVLCIFFSALLMSENDLW